MVELIRRIWPEAELWHMLVGTFGLYLSIIFVFASVYYLLYRSDAARFFFVEELTALQAQTVQNRLETRARRLKTRIAALTEATEELANGTVTHLPAILPSGNRVTSDTYDVAQPHELNPKLELAVRVMTSTGHMLCEVIGFEEADPTPSELADWLREHVIAWQHEASRVRKRVAAIRRNPQKSWGFWDLVYFSVGNQTTAGYGDILPGRTTIRMLAALQVLLGYGLLVVVLNLAIVGAS